MRTTLATILFGVFLWSPLARAQDFAGSYRIEGWNPGSSTSAPADYDGTALTQLEGQIEGEVFRFSGVIDGQTYLGKGIAHTKTGILG
jgi:hypothetical protein